MVNLMHFSKSTAWTEYIQESFKIQDRVCENTHLSCNQEHETVV